MMRAEQYWWIGGVIVVIGLLVGSAAYISGYGTATSTPEVATTTATSTATTSAGVGASHSAGAASASAGSGPGNIGGITNPGASSSSAPYQTVLLQLGTTLTSSGVKATPLAVTEDSRCPEDVQCIQAGTVKVSVRFTFGLYTTTRTFTLGQPQSAYGYTAEMTDVRPTKKEGVTIDPSDYRFVFVIAKP
jgi:hypothetical protein